LPGELGLLQQAEAWEDFSRTIDKLDGTLRNWLAREWARAAQFEHASIASFNRFSLELLALGAAGDLVRAANQAALDEVEHARLSFAVASAYAGAGIGPGPLPLAMLDLSGVELARVARETALDGCVNETLAAAEAEAAHHSARAPVVRAVLARVAADEARHAALACQFVRWAIGVGDASVREAARTGFLNGMQQVRNAPLSAANEPAAPAAHGRLSASERQRIRLTTIAEVLEPLGAALFEARG